MYLLLTGGKEETLNSRIDEAARPSFPKRAIVTAGMPYGNKGLHFGHIGGVFVPADMYARFLRNRIGRDNVIFVSGTDCYGSPIVEGHRKAVENEGFEGTVEQYVERNHDNQVETLRGYDISLNIFEGSGLGCAKDAHQRMTNHFFETLYANGQLELLSTAQFYDTQADVFLNGRQVTGRCPVQGCKSEKAYADECDLGHSYNPEELIAPKSSLTGTVPELRPAYNWYFKLPDFNATIGEHMTNQQADGRVRPFVIAAIQEFLEPPIIYIQNKFREDYDAMSAELPPHALREAEDGKSSFEIEFEHISKRDEARAILEKHDIRFRTGKTLVPFRLTGNIEWGVHAPRLEDEEDLTVWVWPESLWAPISFTAAKIVRDGGEYEEWRDWWCSDDAEIYQFIGEDNIYFYGVAQTALWSAMQEGHAPTAEGHGDELRQSVLVANHHVLFLNKKASSSGKVKPPMAADLLDHYESDQLRAHFLALGLGLKSVSFQPKPYDPTANEKSPDPVLKESALLTNIFNRIARSCFYTAQRINGNKMPLLSPSADVVARADETILRFEELMWGFDLHSTIALMDTYLRDVNKRWAERIKEAESAEDLDAQLQVLADTFYALKVATVLMEPVAPAGTHMIFDYLNLDCDIEDFLSWERIFDGYHCLVDEAEAADGGHLLKELPPKTDFFKKHPSQFK
ncbi:MAG: class I tRNA ligase family protein [bacterium]|nr:class I tRNA ligase family protein [bacterium]